MINPVTDHQSSRIGDSLNDWFAALSEKLFHSGVYWTIFHPFFRLQLSYFYPQNREFLSYHSVMLALHNFGKTDVPRIRRMLCLLVYLAWYSPQKEVWGGVEKGIHKFPVLAYPLNFTLFWVKLRAVGFGITAYRLGPLQNEI